MTVSASVPPTTPEPWYSAAVADRFWAKVERDGLFGCWIWTGAYNRPGENFKRKHAAGDSRRPVFKLSVTIGNVYAHRLALALTDGVPLWQRKGLEACHRIECRNFQCVNPAHLYWGTPEQNRKDRYHGDRP